MLKWYKKLYIGDNAKKKVPSVIKKVNQGKLQYDIYLITLASNEKNLLEIIQANQLIQKTLRKLCPMIVGMASGYGEALEVVEKIVEETYLKQGDTDVRRYLNDRLAEEYESQVGE